MDQPDQRAWISKGIDAKALAALTSELPANRKLVFVASAIGSQLVAYSFRGEPHA